MVMIFPYYQAGMYRVVPLSSIPIHLVGLPTAGALVSVPAEAPAPFVSASDVDKNVAALLTVSVVNFNDPLKSAALPLPMAIDAAPNRDSAASAPELPASAPVTHPIGAVLTIVSPRFDELKTALFVPSGFMNTPPP
jgi:hypothetical protein